MAVGWDALHNTSRAPMTMRERRRLERAGLDQDGEDEYAREVYEERRDRRQERVRLAVALAKAAYEVIEVFDTIVPAGESTRVLDMRHQLEVPA